MKTLFLILVLAFAVSLETRGQGLGAVLSSVQERHMAVHGTPVTWDEIPDGASNNEEFPTEEDVQSLGIEDRIRLLSKAVTVFRSVYGSYVNVSPDDLLAGENTGVAALESFTGVEFPPYGPIEPATYRGVLRQLALDVTRLRVLRTTGLNYEVARTTSTYDLEEYWEVVNGSEVLVARDGNYNVVNSPVWNPESVGIDDQAVSSQPGSAASPIDSITVEASCWESFTLEHPAEAKKTLSWKVEHSQVTTIGGDLPDYWPGGTSVVLGRVAWSPWTGTAPLDVNDGAWRVIDSADSGESVPVPHEVSAIAVEGTWTGPTSGYKKFVPNGFSFAKDTDGEVGYDWSFGSPGNLTVYQRNYACLLLPDFEQGLDAATAKNALAKLCKVTPRAAIDGRALPRPVAGMIVGVNLGSGLEDGTAGAWLGVVPSYSAYWFIEETVDPLDLGVSALPSSWGGWRFDCAPALRFIGPRADFHVVYETTRDPETKPWKLPSCNFGNAGFRQRGWDGVDSFVKAWDSPQIRQVVGRHVLVDVEFGDGFSQKVNIYRRDGTLPNLAPGQLVGTEGLALLREMTIGNPNTPAAMTGFGSGADHVTVTDQTAGTTLDVSLSSVSNYWGDIELKVTNTSDQSELWKEVWDSSSTVTGVDDINWFAASAPNYTVTSTRDGNAQTAVAVTGLPGPFHVWPEKPASLTAGNLTVTWQKETVPDNTAAEKWTTSITGEPDLVEIWRNISNPGSDSGSPPRIPLSVARGGWSNVYILQDDSRILEVRTLLGTARTGTDWIEWTDNGAGGDSVTVHSAPKGDITLIGDDSVSVTKFDFGGLDGAAGTLPWALRRTDFGDGGGGSLVSYALLEAGGIETKIKAGRFASGGQTSIDRGQIQVATSDAAGYPVSSSSGIIWDNVEDGVLSATWDQASRTAWGEPTRVTRQPGGLTEEWSYTGEGADAASDNLHVRSWTGPFGLEVSSDRPDALSRVTGGKWNGITFDLAHQPGGTGADLSLGSGDDRVETLWRGDLLGRFVSSSMTMGDRTISQGLQRGAEGSSTLNLADGFGGTSQMNFTPQGSLGSATGVELPFDGAGGDDLLVDDGLLKTRTCYEEQGDAFLSVWTDAWGRVHKSESASTSGSGNDATTRIFTDPDSAIKRVRTIDAAGRQLVTESIPYGNGAGIIQRSGVNVDKDQNGELSINSEDRYVESVTSVSDGKVVTTLSLTEDNGLREILRTEWTPAANQVVFKVNGSEEIITRTTSYPTNPPLVHPTKTVTTHSSKGWDRTVTFNNLGQAEVSNLAGTGIPDASLDPVWRANGSLEGISLSVGGESVSATIAPEGTLGSLTVPGRGNILGEHSINGEDEIFTAEGTTWITKRDGTEITISGGDVIGWEENVEPLGTGFNHSVTAAGVDTDVNLNAAGAPTEKNYPAGPGEDYTFYPGGLPHKVSLARVGELVYGYTNDGAKDVESAVWPAVTSGEGGSAFSIPSVVESYGHDRAARVDEIGDASGVRSLGYVKGRHVTTDYTSGPLKGYKIVRNRDPDTGRDTGFTLERDGATIHSASKIPDGDSDQTFALTSGSLKVIPQRDLGGRVTGFAWGNASGTFQSVVTQTWERGDGGRIEHAHSNVPTASSFDYLIDNQDATYSFDGRNRHLKCATPGGTWTYQYGAGGQISSAEHRDAQGQLQLGGFSYAFDGIGRRTVKPPGGGADLNLADLLNRTLSWTNDQTKTLRIKTAAGADVHIEIGQLTEDITDFSGDATRQVPIPGSGGGWVQWSILATLEGQGEGAGNPPANSLASPDAKAEQRGAVWVPPVDENFEFDAAGNRESSAQWDYGWDAKNQLVRARTKDYLTAAQGWDITFGYDAEGRRFRKHVVKYLNGELDSEKEITYVWDGWDLLYERQQLPSGQTILERKYLWGPDIADGKAGGAGGLLLIRETKGSATQDIYPLYDGTGHVVALTNDAKELLAEYAYGPFGERIHAKGPLAQANPWRYATKYRDEETGLYYFGKRYLDPVTGQWLSREPLGESESVNLYSYCHNDPINNVDVLGLWEINTQEAANSQRVEWLLMQLSAGSGLPIAPLDEWKLYFPEKGDFGLYKPYGPEDYKNAKTFVQNLGKSTMRASTLEEAEAARQPSFRSAPEWVPSATAALTLGAANTPLNASINSDWLLPTGAGAAGAKFAFGSLKAMLPVLAAGARVDSRLLVAKSASVISRPGTFPRDVSWFNEAAVLDDMASSPIGRQVLDAAQSNQFRLEFSQSYFRQSYGAAVDPSMLGIAFRNKAKVYLPAVGSNAVAASTAIHEGIHMLGVAGSRRAEAWARLAEVMHQGRAINRSSIRGVLQEMNATGAYNHLPWRSGGSTPNFPGIGF